MALPLTHQQLQIVVALPHGTVADYLASSAFATGIQVPTTTAYVALQMPKISLSPTIRSLADALSAMGVPVDVKGDFSGISGVITGIKNVFSSTSLKLDANGVAATAATAVTFGADGGIGTPPTGGATSMVVNQPFVISIVDAPTGTVLFTGVVNDPLAGS